MWTTGPFTYTISVSKNIKRKTENKIEAKLNEWIVGELNGIVCVCVFMST